MFGPKLVRDRYETEVLFLGNDWAEALTTPELQDEQGRVLVRRRLPEVAAGLGQSHGFIAERLDEDDETASVVVGTETDRGRIRRWQGPPHRRQGPP